MCRNWHIPAIATTDCRGDQSLTENLTKSARAEHLETLLPRAGRSRPHSVRSCDAGAHPAADVFHSSPMAAYRLDERRTRSCILSTPSAVAICVRANIEGMT